MRFTVGGRRLDLKKEQVTRAMRGVEPEPIRKHLVEIDGTPFPPKQVLATLTDWSRQSFTTMEAQRVLARLGFVCRRAGEGGDRRAWILETGRDHGESSIEARLASIERLIQTLHVAIAGLDARLAGIEERQR